MTSRHRGRKAPRKTLSSQLERVQAGPSLEKSDQFRTRFFLYTDDTYRHINYVIPEC